MKTELILCDFDGVVIEDDSLDLICAEVGKLEESRRINEAYIAGEIDGKTALERRFAMTDGLETARIEKICAGARITDGAEELFACAAELGIDVLVVSGTLDIVLGYFANKLGFSDYRGSSVPVMDGCLGGEVSFAGKSAIIEEYLSERHIRKKAIIAIGDSPSDKPLFRAASKSFLINEKGVVTEDVQRISSLREVVGYLEGQKRPCGSAAKRKRQEGEDI